MHNIKSITQKDRYGNMFSLEMFEDQGIPMLMMIPDMPNGFNGADTNNHPGKPKGTDTVPAWLTPGENVVNAEASRLPGNQEKIDAMNEEGRAIQQAQGGPTPTYEADGGKIPPKYAQAGSFITDSLLDRIRRVESGGDPNATSEAGAMGQYQIMPSTAAQPGYGVTPLAMDDIRDPAKSREFARQYLMGIAAENPDFTEDEVITAYHSGAGNVRKAKEGREALGPRGQAYAGKVADASGVGPDAFGVSRRRVATGDPNAVPPVSPEKSNLFNVDQMKRAAMYPLEMFGLPVDADAPGKPVPNIFDLLPDDPGMTNVNAAIVKNDTENEARLSDLINQKKANNETVTPELVQMHKDAVKKLADSKATQEKELAERAKTKEADKKKAAEAQSYVPEIGSAPPKPEDKEVTSRAAAAAAKVKAAEDIIKQNKNAASVTQSESEVTDKGRKALAEDPTFAESITQGFKDLFSEMFEPKEIARMIVNYAGSRALGYDHGTSLNYSAKTYTKTIAAQMAQRQKDVRDKNFIEAYTKESLDKYLETGDRSDLIEKPTSSSAMNITGQSGTTFDRFTGAEVPVYKLGSGKDAKLVVRSGDGFVDATSSRFEVVNPKLHDLNEIRDEFQKRLGNQVDELNKTIDKDSPKLDFSTETLANEARALYVSNRDLFRMNNKKAVKLSDEITLAQKEFLEDYKKHINNPDDFDKPTSIEGYYNKRIINLKTGGVVSYNNVKNTDPEKLEVLEQTLMNAAVNAGGSDATQVVKIYRQLWKDAKSEWSGMSDTDKAAFKADGYDPFIQWMQTEAFK